MSGFRAHPYSNLGTAGPPLLRRLESVVSPKGEACSEHREGGICPKGGQHRCHGDEVRVGHHGWGHLG